jgi:flavin reductase (DIM6/NTAB) family NADH-FMN oxidoreductase RutF/DNA-binding GntR family transcriptional regulator
VTVDQNVFREVIGHFASGVTVITAHVADEDFGTTASAMTSLSMDPPMLLVCLNKTSETQRAVLAAGRFAVNILGDDQAELAKRFAVKSPSKFEGLKIARTPSGIPLVSAALAELECRVTETVTGGTHTVFLGEVEYARAREGSPLTYYRGRFGSFEDERQEAAYRLLRGLVLSRELAVDQPVEIEPLAAELGLDGAHVFYALTKLAADGLITREPGRGHVVRPLSADIADAALQARCAIEVAVADAVLGQQRPIDTDALRAHAIAARESVQGAEPDFRALRVSSRRFHETFVSLLDNDLLLELYRRLNIQAIWMRALQHGDGPRYIDPSYLGELVDACDASDADRAKRIIYNHAADVRRIARAAIEHSGGTL